MGQQKCNIMQKQPPMKHRTEGLVPVKENLSAHTSKKVLNASSNIQVKYLAGECALISSTNMGG
jgi:hypothetical protein